jgi:hypothetical protein
VSGISGKEIRPSMATTDISASLRRFQSYSGRGCCVVVREVRRDETSSSNASLGFSRNHLDVSM